MTRYKLYTLLSFGAVLLAFTGCGGSDSANPISPPETIEQRLTSSLDNISTDTDFTIIIESNSGRRFSYSRGLSSENTRYRSASTSKMVTAAIILWLVEQGTMALDDNPQDYLNFWPSLGNHANIELRHLLNFTSGLTDEPLCINLPNASFVTCVEAILENNPMITVPGEVYHYNSTHMQVAGLMAVEATGLDNWDQVFAAFRSDTQLFSNSVYDLPSLSNPRLAGGMHWQASDYINFLRALYQQAFLSLNTTQTMASNQISNATIAYSPISAWPNGFDWRYGFGVWIECASTPFDCSSTTRISSAGAYGAYPFIDFENQYFGIIAREGALGTSFRGYEIWLELEDIFLEWATQYQ